MGDNVNHPAHYETGRFECIDVMLETQGTEAVKSFCICNALKYIYRHKRKNGFEDIRKAIWYLNKAVELEEKIMITIIGLIIGILLFGAGVYYLQQNKNDAESRKIYGVTAAIGAVVAVVCAVMLL